LPRAVAQAGTRGAGGVRRPAAAHPRARPAALAAVADLAGHLRGGLDRAVRGPCDRGPQALVLQGPAVPADRAAVAAGLGLPPPERAVLNVCPRTLLGTAALLALAGPVHAAGADPGLARFRATYQQLVETNTTLSSGDCTLAAQRMAARLKAAGYPD